MASEQALCGDPTCESPSCRQSSIDAYNAAREKDAQEIVAMLIRDEMERREPGAWGDDE